MKKEILRIVNLFIFVILGVLLGFVLIVGAYAMNKDLNYSYKTYDVTARVMKSEANYSKMTDYETSRVDNYTDSIMLLTAFHPMSSVESSISASMKNTRTEVESPRETFSKEIKEGKEIEYSRYWHGYLIFLKPLLRVFDYKQIRIINALIQGMLLFALILLLIKKKYYFLLVPFLCTYFLIYPLVIANSMQYSSVWYIVLVSNIFYLMFQEKIIKYQLHYLYFALVGMLTSYFDLLTYPLATLGFLLIVVISTERINTWQSIRRILVCGISWSFGYAFMWISKIVLAYLVLGDEGVISEAKEAFIARKSSVDSHDAEITNKMFYNKMAKVFTVDKKIGDKKPLEVLFEYKPFYYSFLVTTILGTLSVIWTFIKHKVTLIEKLLNKFNKDSNKFDELEDMSCFSKLKSKRIRYIINIICKLLIVAGLSLMTFVWYRVIRQHSYFHTFMTYRTLSIAFFAIFTILFKLAYDIDRVLKANKNVIKENKNSEAV